MVSPKASTRVWMAARKSASAGSSDWSSITAAATCAVVGMTSFDDWLALTWSLGCTACPSAWLASAAMTSLAFLLVEVPDPV